MKRAWMMASLLMAPTAAMAGDVTGVWLRADGLAKVRFAPCGGAVCGSISWVKDPKAPGKVGQKVFFDMKAAGENAWTGSAFNPEDGKTYSGKMTLSGSSLNTAGCIMGGLLCKSVDWSRVR